MNHDANTTMSENTMPLSRGPLVVLQALDPFDTAAARAAAEEQVQNSQTNAGNEVAGLLLDACDEIERLRLVLQSIGTVCRVVSEVRASKGEPPVSALGNIQDVVEMTLGGAPL
jgi:hypothetical protein